MRLIETIKTLIEQCRSYDAGFDKHSFYGGYTPFSVSLDTVPEDELDEVAKEFNGTVGRLVHFSIGSNSCPTVGPTLYFAVGSLSISLRSKYRKATIAEIDAAVAEIKQKVENCCKPEEKTPEATSARVV